MSKSKGNNGSPPRRDRPLRGGHPEAVTSSSPDRPSSRWSGARAAIEGPHRFLQQVWPGSWTRPRGGPAAEPRESAAASSRAARDLRARCTRRSTRSPATSGAHPAQTGGFAPHGAQERVLRLEAEVAAGPGRARCARPSRRSYPPQPLTRTCARRCGPARHEGGLVPRRLAASTPGAREESVELAVQVDGKVAAGLVVPRGPRRRRLRAKALAEPRVAEHWREADGQVRGRPRAAWSAWWSSEAREALAGLSGARLRVRVRPEGRGVTPTPP